ncbi:hypothetical protein QBC39DRAFT_263131 [Podospora conica]|nr:hypothetical protein QBC39DRAFT_263131 [Schizothecium conicum]
MDSTNIPTPSKPELQAQIGSTSDPVPPRDSVPDFLRPVPTQSWTVSGYPIVDGNYHDLAKDEIKPHVGLMMGGPPSITVYWQNRLCTGRQDQFHVISKTVASTTSLNEYIIRVGDLLRKGACKVDSMNVTRFDVYMVVESELGQQEFGDALYVCGLL